ncbi:MAG: MarR family transcriptional regulator [Methanoregulaceae archaeon]|jgi:DNA-binding MarR family transcriptional regulator|nr:MarR family transcriptional regulator [Methanoregulaceae archaeon]
MDAEERLLAAVEQLIRIRNETSSALLSECGIPDITVKQIGYLKTIDEQGEVTFTRLAEITSNSKPTITELINRFESMECVYRERSPEDRRVIFIRLTEKGRRIARVEENALTLLVERMRESLDHDDLDLLVRIIRKVR